MLLLWTTVESCPGVSVHFNETVAHAIHSITWEDLLLFNPNTPLENGVPTVNMDLSASPKIVANAPSVPMGNAFATEAFNIIDFVLSNQDAGNTNHSL